MRRGRERSPSEPSGEEISGDDQLDAKARAEQEIDERIVDRRFRSRVRIRQNPRAIAARNVRVGTARDIVGAKDCAIARPKRSTRGMGYNVSAGIDVVARRPVDYEGAMRESCSKVEDLRRSTAWAMSRCTRSTLDIALLEVS